MAYARTSYGRTAYAQGLGQSLPVTGTVTATLSRPSVVAAAYRGEKASATASLARPVASATGYRGEAASVSTSLPRPSVVASAVRGERISISASLSRPIATASMTYADFLTISVTLPRPVAVALALTDAIDGERMVSIRAENRCVSIPADTIPAGFSITGYQAVNGASVLFLSTGGVLHLAGSIGALNFAN